MSNGKKTFSWQPWVIGLLIAYGTWSAITLFVPSSQIVPSPPEYVPGAKVGYDYAIALTKAGQKLSLVLMVPGWLLVLCGGILGMLAVLIGPGKPSDGETLRQLIKRQSNISFGVLAIVVGGLGWQLLDRSAAAAQMASAATLSVESIGPDKTGDYEAYTKCIRARSIWLDGKMDHSRLQGTLEGIKDATSTPAPASDTE